VFSLTARPLDETSLPPPPHPDPTNRRSEYDRGVSTYSPDGRLFQIEYAIEAVKVRCAKRRDAGRRCPLALSPTLNCSLPPPPQKNQPNHPPQLGSTAIGIATPEGVVLAVEKRVTSTLLDPSSIHKVAEIDSHSGCAVSGLTADAKTLVDHARAEAQQHRFTYNEPMPLESLTQSLCDLAMRFGEDDDDGGGGGGMSRPFGVALLIAGWDPVDGPVLYHTDPSGTYVKYKAMAIGSGAEGAQSALQDKWKADLSLAEAEDLALGTLKQVMEEKVTASNVDVVRVAPEYHLYTEEEVTALIGRL
jgi:20S proteasome subunit alpha 5